MTNEFNRVIHKDKNNRIYLNKQTFNHIINHMINLTKFIYGVLFYILGQILVWYQINGQFISDWVKSNPLYMSILGIPISLVYIQATKYSVEAFNGELWPQRLIGFAVGMIVFSILTYIHLNETLTPKTIITLILSLIIVLIQIFWK